MNVGPSHRIIAYDAEKAIPLSANEAMRGSPSPWKVFAIIPRQANESDVRVKFSVKESTEEVIVVES
jgi:hypothetical protein